MNLFDLPLKELYQYKPDLTIEPDFNEFWNYHIKKSKGQKLNSEIIKQEYPLDEVTVSEVYIDGYKNSRIRLRYILPKNASKENKVPALVMYHGYNWNNLVISHALKYTLMGYAVLMVDVRGQDINSPDHNMYDNGGSAGWMTKGILNHNNYYYLYVYMDCVRAIEFIYNQDEIDRENIIVEGGSQGGGLALAAGALSDKVRLVMADIPYLCHYKRAVEMSTEGPYNEIYHYFKLHDSLHKTEDQIYRTLSYFDVMNLAQRINGDVLLSIGLEDNICPPSTGFAVYNHINSYKEIRVYPEYAHGGFTQQDEEKVLFLAKRIHK